MSKRLAVCTSQTAFFVVLFTYQSKVKTQSKRPNKYAQEMTNFATIASKITNENIKTFNQTKIP